MSHSEISENYVLYSNLTTSSVTSCCKVFSTLDTAFMQERLLVADMMSVPTWSLLKSVLNFDPQQ